jgi:hypothetical protein
MTINAISRGLILMTLQIFLQAEWSNTLAASPMLTDSAINNAYENCKLFVFYNKNDSVLSSEENNFDNLADSYGDGSIRDQCVVGLRSQTLLPMSSVDATPGGEIVNITIARRTYLPSSHFCDNKPDYDECLEKAFLNYNGFYKDDNGKWRKKVGFAGEVNGNLMQSVSEVINGTIQNYDGITVISEWRHPYHLQDQAREDMITLEVIRRTPFGYIFAGTGYAVGIPVDQTQKSKTNAINLINRIIDVVQSVRMEGGK